MMFVGPVPRLPLRSRVLDQGPIWRDAAVFVSLSSQADDGGRTTDDGWFHLSSDVCHPSSGSGLVAQLVRARA